MALAVTVTAFSAQAFAQVAPEMNQWELDRVEADSIGMDSTYNKKVGSVVSVNTLSGNVVFSLEGIPDGITYNSQRNDDVGFGPAFTSNALQTMSMREDGVAVFKSATGDLKHFYLFPYEETYQDALGWRLKVPGAGNPGYWMNSNSNLNVTYEFDADGKIFSMSMLNQATASGNCPKYTVNHDENGRVLSERYYQPNSYNVSERLEFTYNADNRVASITTMAGVNYRFAYNAQGNLQAVKDDANRVIIDLDYDASGKLVTRVGSSFIEYDAMGRAIRVMAYSASGTLTAESSFAY